MFEKLDEPTGDIFLPHVVLNGDCSNSCNAFYLL